jgi:hypothetical protein
MSEEAAFDKVDPSGTNKYNGLLKDVEETKVSQVTPVRSIFSLKSKQIAAKDRFA